MSDSEKIGALEEPQSPSIEHIEDPDAGLSAEEKAAVVSVLSYTIRSGKWPAKDSQINMFHRSAVYSGSLT